MSITENKSITALRKKMHCQQENCGQHFTFNVSEKYLKNIPKQKQRYTGTCSKYNMSIKLTPSQLRLFSTHMGEPSFNVMKSTFDQLFSREED
jgi:hypothetical protein